jgi:hypothetical protein
MIVFLIKLSNRMTLMNLFQTALLTSCKVLTVLFLLMVRPVPVRHTLCLAKDSKRRVVKAS